jgi:hypothetical protein
VQPDLALGIVDAVLASNSSSQARLSGRPSPWSLS